MSAAEFEQKRVAFRQYLEKEGFVDALQKAFLKLYDEAEKPEDAILFIRQWLCEYCPNEEQFEKMKTDLFNAYIRVAELEVEVEKEKDLVIRSPEELQQELDEGFKSLLEDFQFTQSLLRKYLTNEIIQEYHQVKTPAPFLVRLYDCCKAGFKHHQAEIGVYACNKDCYDTFTLLFDPIIRDYHDFLGSKKPQLHVKSDFGEPSQILNLDPKKKYVMCTYIKISRNLNGFSFLPKMKFDDYLAVENKIKTAIEKLEGEFAGTYQNIIDIDIDDQLEMVKRHASFARGECALKTEAGFDLYFPFGRGVHVNAKETFGVWVNAEDHLTVFAKEENGSLGIVYKRAVDGLKELESKGGLKFVNNRKYGFATADIANLGTAMNATMTMRLPFLSQHVEYLQNMANELQVKINVITLDEDDEENADIVLEVMITKTMGRTEFEIMKSFEEAVAMLINTEVSLERGAVLKVPIPVPPTAANQAQK